MVLSFFGFNKTKVLGAAEKFIQQGKLQNAIVEYEKASKADPKDLTVLNTIGDLYSRIGQADKAVVCFRKVGDAYSAQGFTLKAIAMYKKLTKLSPSAIECNQKLAELYTQQGLYNDARSQYMQVAESHLLNHDLPGGALIFQKILELDPQNAAMQTRLADLYVRLEKPDEAKSIFFRAAESLRDRNMFPAAEEALSKVLALDPNNGRALEMRGQVAMESGNAGAAITYFEQLSDIDSRADALRSLLKAYLKTNHPDGAEPAARKLFTVHQDMSGIRIFGDYQLAGGHVAEALKFYQEFEDRLLAADSAAFTQAIYSCVSPLKEDAKALETIRNIFLKAGDTSHIAEITELLAHACVQSGNFEHARGLYKELIDLEPENPLHLQNYRQIIAKLGTDPTVRPFSPSEGEQAFMVDELEPVTAVVSQEYSDELATAIHAALTDSELFDSYNVPVKAITPLESVLPLAPKDIRLNQRLASLYARTGRLAKAASCCHVLEEVYRIAGFKNEAGQYREMAARYEEKAGFLAPDAEALLATESTTTVFGDLLNETAAEVSASGEESARPDPLPISPLVKIFSRIEEPPAVAAEPSAHEFDLSDEWERIAAAAPVPSTAEFSSIDEEETPVALPALEIPLELVTAQEPATDGTAEDRSLADLLEEISFYVSQSMWPEASAGLDKLITLAPNHSSISEFRRRIAEGTTSGATGDATVEIVDVPSDAPLIAGDDSTIADFVLDGGMLNDSVEVVADESDFQDSATATAASIGTVDPEILALPAIETSQPEIASSPALPEFPQVEGDSFEHAAVDSVVSEETEHAPFALDGEPAAKPEPASISDFALDLDNSLGDDFVLALPSSPVAAPLPTAATAVEPIAASTTPSIEPLLDLPEVSSVLDDLFAEFKEDVEDSTTERDDPDTHYNLGMAFKEMGLLDEAIGELQKVAQAIDHGASFPQTMQAYTWLAQCFVDKGVPEASFRWYERALKLATDEETRTAIHYEMGCAYEIAGNKPQSLAHFTEVYGSNIDYRDVAERIKALKS